MSTTLCRWKDTTKPCCIWRRTQPRVWGKRSEKHVHDYQIVLIRTISASFAASSRRTAAVDLVHHLVTLRASVTHWARTDCVICATITGGPCGILSSVSRTVAPRGNSLRWSPGEDRRWSTSTKKVKRLKVSLALYWNPSQLRSVTCHTEPHLPPDTGKHVPH